MYGLVRTPTTFTFADFLQAFPQVESERTLYCISNPVGGPLMGNRWFRGMAFLPDGRLLVTERPGDLRILGTDNVLSAPLGGVPVVYAQGQGGLLDVALDPNFAENRFSPTPNPAPVEVLRRPWGVDV